MQQWVHVPYINIRKFMTNNDFIAPPGDSLSYHDEMAFSTEDSDNDLHMRNCAVDNKGGWWFNSCYSRSVQSSLR